MDSRATLELHSGRRIRLVTLVQRYTYEGLLMGVPNRSMNEQIMNELIAANTEPQGYGVPYLIRPRQKALPVPDGVPLRGIPSKLPSVTCIASFNSDRLHDDPRYVWSVLQVIWFQPAFAFPIDADALDQILAIDWEMHADGWEP